MKFKLVAVNEKTIDGYKEFLKNNLNLAIHLPFIKVLVSGRAPQANNCHDNAQRYEDENVNFECVRGWLVIDGGVSSSQVFLSAHSVVRDKRDLTLYEITPINSLDPRPFIESYLSEEEFGMIHQHIAMRNVAVQLTILK
jgi:hypothetical protein